MRFQSVEFEILDGLARLTLNRPEAANALDLEMAQELLTAATICESDEGIRAVLLSGSGRMFSAGGDLGYFASEEEPLSKRVRELCENLHAAYLKFARMDVPLVAAVNGAAAGAGMSLACVADIALAAESASFCLAYTAAGLTPDGGATYFLPRMIGVRRAAELMLTNRRLSAAEALDWGIVARVVPDDELIAESEKLAYSLVRGPALALGATKKLLFASAVSDLEAQLEAEADVIVAMTDTRDSREGVQAFLEKRKPIFRGE
jgi:2-(1,2-epoxy-1,2-dihydrophenyl)acetyl-CoA isomerase